VREPCNTLQQIEELGCAVIAIDDGEGRPLRAGDVRRGFGRHVTRVDPHLESALLQHARRGQSDHTASEHGCVDVTLSADGISREQRGTPRQGDTCAAMPIAVNEHLALHLLASKREAGRPKRSQAGDRADDAPFVDQHRREPSRQWDRRSPRPGGTTREAHRNGGSDQRPQRGSSIDLRHLRQPVLRSTPVIGRVRRSIPSAACTVQGAECGVQGAGELTIANSR
jgi:hypothetical protein